MAITFTNNLDVNILSPLKALLNAEFTQNVSFDLDYVERGTNWFNLRPVSDNSLEELASGHIREYEVLIQYYRMIGGQYGKESHIDQLSSIIERLKRLIRNNTKYTDSNGERFFNARLESINYQSENDDMSSEMRVIEATFIANVLEVV